jgi:uncharacterized protein YdeI (YjbR/CyaY-like superfamily)
MKPRAFATPAALHAWMKANHATATELWVRMYKKASGKASVDWDECVVVALTWGWIDGVRKSLDEASFVQRFTPRRARSAWSARNVRIAEELIAARKMKPAGRAQVDAAKADGRWERAYAGPAAMAVPADFLAAVAKDETAQRTYDALDRQNRFAIYYRLHSAKRPETRARRFEAMLAKLASGKPIL